MYRARRASPYTVNPSLCSWHCRGRACPTLGTLVRRAVDFESRRRAERTRIELASPLGGGFLGQAGQNLLGYACIAQLARQPRSLGQLAEASRQAPGK